MLIFHGSNQELQEVAAGSWVTTDVAVAWEFARQKTAEMAGTAHVVELEVDDDDVSWDVASMAAGVEDERGLLRRTLPVRNPHQPGPHCR